MKFNLITTKKKQKLVYNVIKKLTEEILKMFSNDFKFLKSITRRNGDQSSLHPSVYTTGVLLELHPIILEE